MIEITKDDLKKLEYISSGKFGMVYKKDNETAYKIYHPIIYEDLSGRPCTNPAILLPRYRFNELIRRSKHLKYTGGVKDLIFIDGHFGGVCIPYYDGKKLNEIMDYPLKIKIELSKQLVRNAKELSEHLIFPTDYKLNNAILSNNKAQIIDIDDCRTHVYYTPSVICRTMSVNAIGETIQDFLYQYKHLVISKDIKLSREPAFSSFRYKRIEDYLKAKEKERKIIFVDDETDLKLLKELISITGFEVIYIAREKAERTDMERKMLQIIESEIPLYDAITRDKLEQYYSIENISEAFKLENDKKLIKIYQK